MTPKRHGIRWTVTELITLQREVELLNMPMDEIAQRHQRTVEAIHYKIEQEGFVIGTSNQVDSICDVSQMKGMVKQVVTHFMETRRQKQQKQQKQEKQQNVIKPTLRSSHSYI
jgi:hypothetical protein